MFLAFMLSGFFMRKRWWIKALLVVFILPWATPALPAYMSIHWFFNGQWGMLNNVLYMLFGIDGPVYLNSHWMGLACNISAYIWKTLPFWTIIMLAGRMAVPQELYEAAAVDGASGLTRFWNVTFPLMANLYFVCTLLDTVFALGDFNCDLFRLRRRAGHVHRGAGDAGHPLCLHGGAAATGRGRGDVGAAAADPAGDPADAQAAHVGGTAMSATVARRKHSRLHYRLNGWAVEAASVVLAAVLVIWSVTPIYNMIIIALDSHDDIFSGSLWPENPSLESFRVVVTQDFWYLARFWHQFGNSFFVGLMTMFMTLFIGSLTSFTVGRLTHPPRLAADQRSADDLCHSGLVPGDPVLPDHADLWPGQQPVVGDRGADDICHALCDLHLLPVRQVDPDGAGRVRAHRRRLALADLLPDLSAADGARHWSLSAPTRCCWRGTSIYTTSCSCRRRRA